MPDVVLCGGNLAVVVAARQLAESGAEVALLTGGERLGGHFAGVDAGGRRFDGGLVVVDRAVDRDGGAALDTYDPDHRYDWTRFGKRIDDWITRHCQFTPVQQRDCIVQGRRWPDHLTGDRLDIITALGRGPLPDLPVTDFRHATHKSEPMYDDLLYDDVAPLHHGRETHDELVSPFAAKVLGGLRSTLLARYHRQAWLPLLWPNSVAASRADPSHKLSPPLAWVPKGGSVASLVDGLASPLAAKAEIALDASPIRSVRRYGRGWSVAIDGKAEIKAPQLVMGTSLAKAAAWLALPEPAQETVGLVLVIVEVRATAIRAPIGTINAVDPDVKWYRMTDQDQLSSSGEMWHRVAVEYGAAAVTAEDPDLLAADDVRRLLDVSDPDSVRTVAPARRMLMSPSTVRNVRNQTAFLRTLRSHVPEAHMTGHLAGVGATTINDHIVQGLRTVDLV